MRARSVKTKMDQLVRSYGSIEKVADVLKISRRWAFYLKAGRIPGIHLFDLINALTDGDSGAAGKASCRHCGLMKPDGSLCPACGGE